MAVNAKTANMLQYIRDDIVTVRCYYARDKDAEASKRVLYTWLCEKTLAQKLCLGDAVVVDSAKGLAVVYVQAVDDFVDIDVDTAYTYQYVVQRVDTSHLDEMIAHDKITYDAFETQRRKQAREMMRRQMLDAMTITNKQTDKLRDDDVDARSYGSVNN